jgi:hypothetical protein
MSIESLLFAVLFLVIPLIQMFREARKRALEQGQQRAAHGPSISVRPPRPPNMHTQLPREDMDANPDVTAERPASPEAPLVPLRVAGHGAVPQTLSDKIAARRRSTQRQATTESLRDRAVRKDMRTVAEVIGGMRSRGGVQRAIVVMAILGPCRAVNPHDWRHIDGPG